MCLFLCIYIITHQENELLLQASNVLCITNRSSAMFKPFPSGGGEVGQPFALSEFSPTMNTSSQTLFLEVTPEGGGASAWLVLSDLELQSLDALNCVDVRSPVVEAGLGVVSVAVPKGSGRVEAVAVVVPPASVAEAF